MNTESSRGDVYQLAVQLIDLDRAFAPALVLQASGSTTQKVGVRAVVEATGKVWGTNGADIAAVTVPEIATSIGAQLRGTPVRRP